MIPASSRGSFLTDKSIKAYNMPGGGTLTIAVPENLKHFGQNEEGSLRRQAISMAVDRKLIAKKIFNDTVSPAVDFLAKPINGYSTDIKGNGVLSFNAAKAKELWAKADAISKYDGQLTFAYNADGGAKPIYDAIVNQLKNNLGIDVATNPMPTFQEFRNAVSERQIKGAFRTGWQPDYPSAENYLFQLYDSAVADGNGSNDGDYKNPKFDDLMTKAYAAQSTDDANKLYQQAQEILLNDLPAIPLYNSNANAVFGKSVKNVEPNWKGVPVFYEITKE